MFRRRIADHPRGKSDSHVTSTVSLPMLVRRKLSSQNEGCGLLVGERRDHALHPEVNFHVLDCVMIGDAFPSDMEALVAKVRSRFGVGCSGLWFTVESDLEDELRPEKLGFVGSMLICKPSSGDVTFLEYIPGCECLYPCNTALLTTPDVAAEYSLLRVRFPLNFQFQSGSNLDRNVRNIGKATDGLIGLYSGSTAVFRVKELLVMQSRVVSRVDDDPAVGSLDKAGFDILEVVEVEVLHISDDGDTAGHCPVLSLTPLGGDKYVTMQCRVDVLLSVDSRSPVSSLWLPMAQAVSGQISEMQDAILEYSEGQNYAVPRVFHFFNSSLPTLPVTVIYPETLPDKELANVRQSLHRYLLIPADRPLFRRSISIGYQDDVPYLTDVHKHIRSSGIKEGAVSLVRGHYHYRHYNQDRLNDSGWGCAYRSLQTLASWFYLQGYVDRPAPSILEIQQTLVDIGDKVPAFAGTRDWIGSFEVQAVLNQLYNVESKILHCSSGAEIQDKIREIALHFQTHGTPVMIGGAQYAYTILGAHFCEESGDVRLLILDPHYVGAEDIQRIISKGWCSWKQPQFWNPAEYYNLCMPMVPSCI